MLRAPAFAVAGLLFVAGCGPIHDALEKSRAPDAPGQFGVATRERLDTDPDGRTFRIMITANAEATWAEAATAMTATLPKRCDDGEPFVTLQTTPDRDGDDDAAAGGRRHPAGTTFIETYQCSGPLEGEFELAADADEATAIALARTALVGDGDLVTNRHFVTLVPFDTCCRKYVAIERHVGMRILAGHSLCAGGQVVLRKLVVGSWPRTPARRGRDERGQVVVGTDVECVPPAAAAP